MALIKCSECGKEFSDKANACPNCACPTDKMIKSANKKTKSKDYNELTSAEKASLRICMRQEGANSTSAIVLLALGGACFLIGFFVGFWLLFLILGFCLYIAGAIIYSNNEKKYYNEHPNSITIRQKDQKANKQLLKKVIPILIASGIAIISGCALLATEDSKVLAYIFISCGLIGYFTSLYLFSKKSK